MWELPENSEWSEQTWQFSSCVFFFSLWWSVMVMMVSLPCCNTIIVIIFFCLGSFKCLLHLQGPTEEGEFTLRNNICVFVFFQFSKCICRCWGLLGSFNSDWLSNRDWILLDSPCIIHSVSYIRFPFSSGFYPPQQLLEVFSAQRLWHHVSFHSKGKVNKTRARLPRWHQTTITDLKNFNVLLTPSHPSKVLDLHENKLTSLPEDIGKLASLQASTTTVQSVEENAWREPSSKSDVKMSLCSTVRVRLQILNVEKNLLKNLPDSIGDLRLLQTLNLKGWL